MTETGSPGMNPQKATGESEIDPGVQAELAKMVREEIVTGRDAFSAGGYVATHGVYSGVGEAILIGTMGIPPRLSDSAMWPQEIVGHLLEAGGDKRVGVWRRGSSFMRGVESRIIFGILLLLTVAALLLVAVIFVALRNPHALATLAVGGSCP